MTFLFVLTAGPRTAAVETVVELSASARALGHKVEVFLAGDGVVHAAVLGQLGQVTLCEADLRWRQSQPVELPGVHRGSLRDLAKSCRAADRVLVFS